MAKKKIAFNILDWIIVVAVVLSALGIWFRFGLAKQWQIKNNTVTAYISFSISDIKETSFTGGYFAEGSPVYNADAGNSLIGHFAGEDMFRYVPARYYEHSRTGEVVVVQSVSDRIDLDGVIISTGLDTENGFLYGGSTYIAPGQTIKLSTPQIEVSVLVTDITIVENADKNSNN